MVRVSGYTAYFQDLNPQMQQEIITRAEYDLVDGLEHRYHNWIKIPRRGVPWLT